MTSQSRVILKKRFREAIRCFRTFLLFFLAREEKKSDKFPFKCFNLHGALKWRKKTGLNFRFIWPLKDGYNMFNYATKRTTQERETLSQMVSIHVLTPLDQKHQNGPKHSKKIQP